MFSGNYDKELKDMLCRIQEYGNRMANELPYTMFEMQGRMMTMYGMVCKTAGEVYNLEQESRRTLLGFRSIDLQRKISQLKGLRETLKTILDAVPLFMYRDYNKYRQLTFDDIMKVKQEFLQLEQLPKCPKGVVEEVIFNATEFAYKMYDLIFLGINGMITLFERMYNDRLMLQKNPELRFQRWQMMMDDYHPSADTGLADICPEANLSEQAISDYVFSNPHMLTQQQVDSYIRQACSNRQQQQQAALAELRQPARGAYADLFTCRAAHELATLLVPAIAHNVDFRFNYQYAAWAMAMRDLGLIRSDKRNGVLLMNFINQNFLREGCRIKDQNLLTRWLHKKDFHKLKDTYWLCLSIINLALQKDLSSLGITPDCCQPHPRTPHPDHLSHLRSRLYILIPALP